MTPLASQLAPISHPSVEEHLVLLPSLAHVFASLDVGATLSHHGKWYPIYRRSPALDLLNFELEHGVESERVTYNSNCLNRARRSRRSVVAQHSGFTDLFVPIDMPGEVTPVIVTGPFVTSQPTSAAVQQRWRSLTGTIGHPADPEFSHYVSTTFSMLALEGAHAESFQRMVEKIAEIMAGHARLPAALLEVEALASSLSDARLPDRMWVAARAMLDATTSRTWQSPNRARELMELGVTSFPEQVLVGLFINREQRAEPLEEMLRRRAFQRKTVEYARQAENVLSAPIGEHGFALLAASRGSARRTHRFLTELGHKVAGVARRQFGLGVHMGTGYPAHPLVTQYEEALASAQWAVSHGLDLVEDPPATGSTTALASLRRELSELVEEKPSVLPARFDRYLEAVSARSGYRVDVANVHAEAGFERVFERASEASTLDPRSLAVLLQTLDRSATAAGTLDELFAAYRTAVQDLTDGLTQVSTARRDRSLRRAEDFMRKHFAESISLARVAKVAGFAPTYFSELFKKKHGVTFESYLLRLRLERVQRLLSTTSLNLQRIAQLTGFSSRHYLGRVFKSRTGETPIEYRERVRRARS